MTHVVSVACGGLDEGFTIVATSAGKVYSFGKDLFGRLGHGDRGRTAVTVDSPQHIPTLSCLATSVAAGTEHAACLTNEGHVWSWGRNVGGCLGRGTLGSRSKKVSSSCAGTNVGADHHHALDASLPAFVHDVGHGRSSWIGTHYGRLPEQLEGEQTKRSILANVIKIDCEYHYSGALLSDGRLVAWGTNSHGQLGVGDIMDRSLPNQVKGVQGVMEFSLGTRHAAAVTKTGKLYTWGDGVHGNLGLGDYQDKWTPTHVVGNNLDLQRVVKVSCSRAQGWQIGGAGQQSIVREQRGQNLHRKKKTKHTKKTKNKTTKNNKNKKSRSHTTKQKFHLPKVTKLLADIVSPGGEGGHTCCVTSDGHLYTFGTAHNGVLANLGRKTNALGQAWDENVPYLVGGPLRDQVKLQNSLVPHEPMSPFACWPSYDTCGPFVHVVASHDHCVVVNAQGELWGWGNGTDGRVGVERFLNMSGERKNGKNGASKPPVMDRCKCIMMGPHRVGLARKEYWPGGASLQRYRVLEVASGRNHMACIAVLNQQHGNDQGVVGVDVDVDGTTCKQNKVVPLPPWLPIGERVGYNDVTPPVKIQWSP